MILTEENYLEHYGILRKSGRYPWGSGGTQNARNRTFLSTVENLKKEGMSETEIARGYGITTTQLRAAKSIARTQQKQEQILQAQRLKDKGYSNVAIGKRMGMNESSVRALLAPGEKDKVDVLQTTASMLEKHVNEKDYVDIGSGVENHIGVSRNKLDTAVAMLQEKGYIVRYPKVTQLGTGEQTTIRTLSKPGLPYPKASQVKQITAYSEDGGRSFLGLKPPISVSSRRIKVNYAEDGGSNADGVIYVRPGVKDLSLGKSRYAQVRIAVDGTHYLKGMAMYKHDLPPGTDLVFNTSKSNTGRKKDAFKELKNDPDNPFGAVVRQRIDLKTGKVTSAMNIVNEEGDWGKWSKSLSSQFLSKQDPHLAKTQLSMTYERRKNELSEISKLTNPVVKRKLLETYAEATDSAAVHLKAAALPRQASHVILPFSGIKEGEIYAPNFRPGERVVLVRYPHGGTFEIPELKVNNNYPEAKSLFRPAARDAVGIHPKVASRLSGADFDGDTVLVIPNNRQLVRHTTPLEELKNFDPRHSFPPYDGMPTIDGGTWSAKVGKTVYPTRKDGTPIIKGANKQNQMGQITNLIADMTIHGASNSELASAVRHSMVVIDAEKHSLNYKASAIANGIPRLKAKYQGGPRAGASTLITLARSEKRVPDRKPRSASKGGPIDPKTGKKVFEPTGVTYVNKQGKTVSKTRVSTHLAETENAHKLSSGTPIENIYADHSNRLKALANDARKQSVAIKTIAYSPSAKATYSKEVASLNAKLNVSLKNRPLERAAQVFANNTVAEKKRANPDMDPASLTKIKAQALEEARARFGAKKDPIQISQDEWNAIQAGAISTNKLTQIINNSDLSTVKKLATPRVEPKITPTKLARANAMLASGYTQAEVADALGVSLSTLKASIS